jgi:hypothetical protein
MHNRKRLPQRQLPLEPRALLRQALAVVHR